MTALQEITFHYEKIIDYANDPRKITNLTREQLLYLKINILSFFIARHTDYREKSDYYLTFLNPGDMTRIQKLRENLSA